MTISFPAMPYNELYRAIRVPFPPRYNIAPTDQIPIVRIDPRDGDRELTFFDLRHTVSARALM